MATTVDELLVYQKALAAMGEQSALVSRTRIGTDFDLRGQLFSAGDRVVADISEGFEQKTDRHFAQYLYNARGGAHEVCGHLDVCIKRGLVAADEIGSVAGRCVEIGKMLTGLIDYLKRSDWRDRR
jgi:four helix bundle protein